MLIRKDAIHPPPIEAEEFLLNLVKKGFKFFFYYSNCTAYKASLLG